MARVPVFRISLSNATLLSGGYLLVGALVEVIRRTVNPRWADELSWKLEAFPAGILRVVGLLEPLREAYAHGLMSQTQVRLAYAGSAVLVIYVIGVMVGAAMWLLMKLGRREDGAQTPPPASQKP